MVATWPRTPDPVAVVTSSHTAAHIVAAGVGFGFAFLGFESEELGSPASADSSSYWSKKASGARSSAYRTNTSEASDEMALSMVPVSRTASWSAFSCLHSESHRSIVMSSLLRGANLDRLAYADA